MARRRHESREQRQFRFEQFEQRLVMSAQAVAAVLPELEIAAPALTGQVVSHPLLENASPTTQAANLAEQYGFDGAGQTVAVIDSGIAWDHHALGGGFGEGHKVVGGWDFAENDANPYDDGPAGYHGTHVAGIIGSEDSQYRGVSSGADLVALRVFDDQGLGDLDLVERALQWVHDHKDDFANPITTVNLSLGNEWNDFTTPEWATLEDEFAQLEADGMFISVAAGNSFLSYGATGLSYPAVSEHVVPVASHGDDGLVSEFSQRAENVLVAPGESIKSTVPDFFFGGTSGNEFLGSTGTSMSAPYVAAASAVLRQANEFMNVEHIDQDLLYRQFRETADQVYDQVTGGYYHRINLEAALASVVQDVHGDSITTATRLDSISNGGTLQGTIGKLTDTDHFQFTAEASGQVTLQFSTTNDLIPLFELEGIEPQQNGNQVTFAVEAGRQYSFSVGGQNGNGHYSIDLDFQHGIASQNIGKVVSSQLSHQTIEGEANYRFSASRDGFVTLQTSGSDAHLSLKIFDSQMNLVAQRQGNGADLRLDFVGTKNETYYLAVNGHSSETSFQIDNLVSLDSGILTIHGTNHQDALFVDARDGFQIDVNGLHYRFDNSEIHQIEIFGHRGHDEIQIDLGADDDQVGTRPDGIFVANSRYRLSGYELESLHVTAGGGVDAISMQDSVGNDVVQAIGNHVSFSGTGHDSVAIGFDTVLVKSSSGHDTANLTGTHRNELFVSREGRHSLRSDDFIVVVDQFASTQASGGSGNDRANVFGTANNDHFVLNPTFVSVTTESQDLEAVGFETINAMGGSGHDSLTLRDSVHDDTFTFDNGLVTLNGRGYSLAGHSFHDVTVTSSSGSDTALVMDSTGNDTFRSSAKHASLASAVSKVDVIGFQRVNAVSVNGGFDQAIMVGSIGNDVANFIDGNVSLTTTENLNRAIGFNDYRIDLLDGIDEAYLLGSNGDETLRAGYSELELESTLNLLNVLNVENTVFDGNGGVDQVAIEDFGPLDVLNSLGDKAEAVLKDHSISATDFDMLEARTVDDAIADYDLDSADFQYMLRGNWRQL